MIVCLDLEGVLIPEIWIKFAKKTKIKALERTTRDEPSYDRLMQYRLRILKEHGLKLKDIQRVIAGMKPLPGAKGFLKKLKSQAQVIILSDTFYEFAAPLMKQLDYPTLFCHSLKVDKKGNVIGYKLRQKDSKRKAVLGLKALNFHVRAAGDSYNDLTMIQTADKGFFFKPPASITKKYKRFPVTRNYDQLLRALLSS